MPAQVVRALVGSHPASARQLREVTAESPLWVIGVVDALGHSARPVVPDGLMEDFAAWRAGRRAEAGWEPDGWREALEEALRAALELEASPFPRLKRALARVSG